MKRSRRSSCSKPVSELLNSLQWEPSVEFQVSAEDEPLPSPVTGPPVTPITIPRPLQVDISGTENSTTGSFTLKTVTAAAESELSRLRDIVETDDILSKSFAERTPNWEDMLPGAIKAIVSLSTLQVRSFDTEKACTSEASGFIVDLAEGIILSNRHVVSVGPIVCEAVFWNHEEANAIPIYRDPIHDFGFFRVNMRDLKYSKLGEIKLDASGAKLGKEVRVVGNNAGEKLSILGGTLARLDRPAPRYGLGNYNDINTFYIQAASSTTGGSSGSPVLDISGNAIALNAGGKSTAASSYFLPLDRVVRALSLVKQGKPISRGTLQVEFRFKPYDQLRRLGISQDLESLIRKERRNEIGMLIVQKVLEKGPADGILQPGDILVSIDNRVVTGFVECEDIFDDNVGKQLSIVVERGGTILEANAKVQDLHSITPNEYVEYSGGVFHNLSFQMALSFGVPVEGVFVANPGYAFALADISRFSLIISIDGHTIETLDDFIAVLSNVPSGARIPVRFSNLNDLHRQRVSVLTADKRWYPFKKCRRCDETGLWNSVPFSALNFSMQSLTLSESASNHKNICFASLPESYLQEQSVSRVFKSMCVVKSQLPFLTDGLGNDGYVGLGLIMSVSEGLVLCDKSTVPIPLADIRVSFGNAIMVSAKCVFIHPIHNFCFIKFNRSELPANAPLEEIVLDPAVLTEYPTSTVTDRLVPGYPLRLITLSASCDLSVRDTKISQVAPAIIRQGPVPKYRPFNFDCYFVEDCPSSGLIGGVLLDPAFEGKLSPAVVFWTSFSGNERGKNRVDLWAGIGMEEIGRCLSIFLKGTGFYGYCLDSVELCPIGLIQAQSLGLPWDKVAEFSDLDKNKKKAILQVVRRQCNTLIYSDNLLCEGDIVLSVNKQLCARLRDVEALATENQELSLEILRDKAVLKVKVPTTQLDSFPRKRVIGWAGAVIQNTPLEVAHFSKKVPTSVYVTWVDAGSPAESHQLFDNTFIMEVNEQPVATLDAFLSVVSCLAEGSFVRLKIMDAFRSTVKILPLRVNNHYFPIWCVSICAGSEPEILGINTLVVGGTESQKSTVLNPHSKEMLRNENFGLGNKVY